MPEAVRDGHTSGPGSAAMETVPDGVRFKRMNTLVDDRGIALRDLRRALGLAAGSARIRVLLHDPPGRVKGWGLHRGTRIATSSCTARWRSLYDDREDSPTRGLLSQIVLTEHNRRLMNIPIGVWHADRNVGENELLLVNFPTRAYDHENPDKYRLPIDTELIPHSFGDARGW